MENHRFARCMRAAFACLAIIGCANANADLIEVDWVPGSGDRMLTRDSSTGLDWLDLTATRGRSMNEVWAGYGGWMNAGFRYATMSEVMALINSMGFSEGIYDSWSRYQDEILGVKRFITLLGAMQAANPPSAGNPFGQQATYGMTAERIYGCGVCVAYYYGGFDASDTYARVYLSGFQYADGKDSSIGSFLVRQVSSVPEPDTVLLMAAGLAVVRLLARK